MKPVDAELVVNEPPQSATTTSDMKAPLSTSSDDTTTTSSSSSRSDSSKTNSGGLPSSPASSSWWSKRISITKATEGQQQTARQEEDEMRELFLQESLDGNVQLLKRRPARICVVFPCRQTKPELRFRRQGSNLVLDHVDPESVFYTHNPIAKPFVEYEEGQVDGEFLLLQQGDVIESINGLQCTSETTLEKIDQVWQHNNESGLVCLTVSTTSESTGLCQVVLFGSPPTGDQDDSPLPEPRLPDLGLQLRRRQGLLQIQRLSSTASNSCLVTQLTSAALIESGDFCVAMATTLCAALEPNEAKELWQSQCESCREPYLSLLTVKASASQRRWNRVRRAAVAVGGGTLLGVGGVLMVTPLHPVGHAMTLGGVGVLGTEFEAPKRALQAAKDKFTMARKGGVTPATAAEVPAV